MGGRKSKERNLQETVLEMRIKTKELQRMAIRCEKQARTEEIKERKAQERGNTDSAEVYAENARAKRSEANNYLKLASKVDVAASRFEAAYHSQEMTTSMVSAFSSLDKMLSQLDAQTLMSQMSDFQRIFANLDVRAQFVENELESATVGGIKSQDAEIPDELSLMMPAVPGHALTPGGTTTYGYSGLGSVVPTPPSSWGVHTGIKEESLAEGGIPPNANTTEGGSLDELQKKMNMLYDD